MRLSSSVAVSRCGGARRARSLKETENVSGRSATILTKDSTTWSSFSSDRPGPDLI